MYNSIIRYETCLRLLLHTKVHGRLPEPCGTLTDGAGADMTSRQGAMLRKLMNLLFTLHGELPLSDGGTASSVTVSHWHDGHYGAVHLCTCAQRRVRRAPSSIRHKTADETVM
jgi:hypothetical protein